MRRRQLLIATLAIPAIPTFAKSISVKAANGLTESRLVYLTPLKTDGDESACQGEVWFAYSKDAIYVNTQAEAWRAEAIRKGLTDTRMWVGDVGMWKQVDGAYKELPKIRASGSIVKDSEEWDAVFPAFGEKYSDEWPTWGPRFKNGLENGSRVLLKYTEIHSET